MFHLEPRERDGVFGGDAHLHGRGRLAGVGSHRGFVLRRRRRSFLLKFFFVNRREFFSSFFLSFFLSSFLFPRFLSSSSSSLLTKNGAWLGSMLFSVMSSQSTGGLWKPQSPETPRETGPPPSAAAAAAFSGSQSSSSGRGTFAEFSNPPCLSSWGQTNTRF